MISWDGTGLEKDHGDQNPGSSTVLLTDRTYIHFELCGLSMLGGSLLGLGRNPSTIARTCQDCMGLWDGCHGQNSEMMQFLWQIGHSSVFGWYDLCLSEGSLLRLGVETQPLNTLDIKGHIVS